ncbi:MAG: efflux RND transporter periplasmic adaptor subunit [Schleiferiaceae bacterium]|nr:efflux RND transporter periplasmic adaptor subunit [Schleiferiaceae bacterium]
MKNRNRYLLALISFSLLACNQGQTTKNEFPVTETIAVKTYQLQSSEGTLSIKSSGVLTTENEAKYAFKIGGVIDHIYVSEGESFKMGKLLASLKTTEIDAGVVQAKLGLEKAERDLKRLTNLYRDSVATLEQLQNTETAYEIAKKQVESVSFNRTYAYIYAGNDGFVTKKIANEGEIISGGMPVLAINENTNGAWILKVGLSDRDWAIVGIGNSAQVAFDAFPEKLFSGIVLRKSLAADMGSGSFQVEIKVNCDTLNPAIGMFGKASILTDATQKYQSIPYDALIEADGKNAFVFLPLPNGKVKRQAITISFFDDTHVHVKSGLENVKEVIRTNSAFLNENSIITIIP